MGKQCIRSFWKIKGIGKECIPKFWKIGEMGTGMGMKICYLSGQNNGIVRSSIFETLVGISIINVHFSLVIIFDANLAANSFETKYVL